MPRPTKRSCLACLTKKRLIGLAVEFAVDVSQAEPKAAFVEALAGSKAASFARVLESLPATELRLICRSHELATSGSKPALVARIRADDGAGEPAQTSLLGGAEDGHAEDELAAVFARAQPSITGLIPLLDQRELATVLRRLAEHHGVTVALAGVVGVDGLGAAIARACELPVLLAELDREQLVRVCERYALQPRGTSREDLLRAILSAAAGVTEDEALELEAGHAQATPRPAAGQAPAEPPSPEQPSAEPAQAPAQTSEPAPAERYLAALDVLPRGVLHRVEADFDPGDLPRPGELVRARQRQYLVSEVVLPATFERHPRTGLRPATLVKLVCLDDDAQGRELDVFWELEVGAERIDPTRQGLAGVTDFDPPARFGAYYHALQWNCVTTATSPEDERVQAPFRAGIAIMQHQLVPLQKVLALPRANAFIADDVGLGKTIEAGLVLQELLLRQRLDLILIVCPSAICLQWQGEMERRFGLRFEIINREHLARIRRERGVGTNPWECGRRFIVSYQTLRRPEYQEALRVALGERRARSMLVLDEAHTVAPASNQLHYAVDSNLTKLARQLAPRFENRLFLSATPHNGHSNSFSALLELLDPARFTRGVPVEGARAALEAVMVRRLKRDLIGNSTLSFPTRRLVELRLTDTAGTWHLARAVQGDTSAPRSTPLRTVGSSELELSDLLEQYRTLCAPTSKRDHRVFICLQKRLLSSCAAFARTLDVHLTHTGLRILEKIDDTPPADATEAGDAPSDEIHGEELDGEVEQEVASGGRLPSQPSARARAEAVVERMQTLLRGAQTRPEGKLLGVIAWIREHQCPAAGRQWFATPADASFAWTDTRLIIFTEYADTAAYVIRLLRAALAGSEREDDRIAYFHGAMSDDKRRELQAEFNGRPSRHPVRILVATDAAREGVNLQAYCSHLIHYDIPWNPGRLEQRNGRIDRTLQPAPEVVCMYFAYPQRREDRVLQVLVAKVQRIHAQLGSLSAVIVDRIEDTLETFGIDAQTQQRLDLGDKTDIGDADAAAVVEREVESIRPDAARLAAEIEAAADCYERSREFFAPDADGLRETVSMALALAGAANDGRFEPTDAARDPDHPDETTHYLVPTMPDDWARTLDTLRPPRPASEPPWAWRAATPPKPVVFEPLRRMTDDVIQLHLEHPLVRRALARFTAQGYAAHDLRRATLVRYAGTHERVVLIARMSLFGAGASRLHDSLVHLVGEIRGEGPVTAIDRPRDIDDTLARLRDALSARTDSWQPSAVFLARHRARIGPDVRALWPRLAAQARSEALELVRRLDDRGAREADQLREILKNQQKKIGDTLVRTPETDADRADPASRQRRLDRAHMQDRREALGRELASEPPKLREHYRVLSERIEAVGLVYLVPETR